MHEHACRTILRAWKSVHANVKFVEPCFDYLLLYVSMHSYCMMAMKCHQIHEHTFSDQLFLLWCYYSSTTRNLVSFFAQEVFLLGRILLQCLPWKPPSLVEIEWGHQWFNLLDQDQTLIHCWLKFLSALL